MRLVLLAGAVVGVLVGIGGAEVRTPQQADAFAQKLAAILSRSQTPPSGQRTEFDNDEINAYLQLRLAPAFPTGVAEPEVTLVGEGRLSGRAIVDLDGLKKKGTGGWFDPSAYLGGRLPVVAVGTLKTGDGAGQLVLERAEISGIPVPVSLLQELVTYYTRSADLPNGVNLNDPFPLPSHIQRIDVDEGRAIVVQ
ncbi:MAG: hypothetical protein OEW19_18430 [Acidobacteriota bacterium]|nr:hypothetical protein [Acidobacteriota bacterium]